MKSRLVRALVAGGLLGSVILGAAPIAPGPTSAQSAPGEVDRDGRVVAPEVYRIGPEDSLLISVWKNDAMSRAVLVRPDGKISLPLVNDVQASGLTVLELRDVLTGKLKEFMPSPEVSVIVTDVRSLKVSVIGEVSRPGRYDLKSYATVLDVLAMAGGFTQFASRSRIVILTGDGKSMKRIPFNYNKVPGEQENFYLRNGDIVLVP
ncbi:MAG: polysaccharide biosynthesis/export family protein [Candidatus Rokuibacteriota bacterium]